LYFSQLCGAAAVLFGKSKPTSGFDLGALDKTWLLNVPAAKEAIRQPYSMIR
jgi:hypothetical protein